MNPGDQMVKNILGAEYGTYERKERCMQVSVRNYDRKSPLGRPSYRKNYKIKIDSKKMRTLNGPKCIRA
jgi:hypothetical protein